MTACNLGQCQNVKLSRLHSEWAKKMLSIHITEPTKTPFKEG